MSLSDRTELFCQQQRRKAAASRLRTINKKLGITSVKPEQLGSHVLLCQGWSATHDMTQGQVWKTNSQKSSGGCSGSAHELSTISQTPLFPLEHLTLVQATYQLCELLDPSFPGTFSFPLSLASILSDRVEECLQFIFKAFTYLQGLHYWAGGWCLLHIKLLCFSFLSL